MNKYTLDNQMNEDVFLTSESGEYTILFQSSSWVFEEGIYTVTTQSRNGFKFNGTKYQDETILTIDKDGTFSE